MECSLYHCSLHGLQPLSTRYQPTEQARLDLEATGGAADLAYLRHLERQKQDDVVRWARRLDELKLAQPLIYLLLLRGLALNPEFVLLLALEFDLLEVFQSAC